MNQANTSDTDSPFLVLYLAFSNRFVIYQIRDYFDFDIVNFPFADGDVPRPPSYGVYISQLIKFARVCSHVYIFDASNEYLIDKRLAQGW